MNVNTTTTRARRGIRSTGGFNLVELIVVMAIIGSLALLSLPAITSTLRSSYLGNSGRNLMNQIGLARQTAISRNLPVEVRFYKLPGPEAAVTAAPDTWWAYQIFVVENSGVTAASRMEFLQKLVYIDPSADRSALFADLSNATSTHREMTPGTTDPSILPYNKNYRYIAFRINPSGAADLTAEKNFVTLVLRNDKTLAQGGNFFTVQIDPVNGTARSFRP